MFKKYFSSTTGQAEREAIRIAKEKCLPNAAIRKRWIRSIRDASVYMLQYSGPLEDLANGRMLEFKFLVIALKGYEARNADS
jgi:hypothetical protein